MGLEGFAAYLMVHTYASASYGTAQIPNDVTVAVMTPPVYLDSKNSQGADDGEPGGSEEFPKYRALVRTLMWLSVMTRPNIANALRACARHSHNPSPRHWKPLLQVAAYVNATKEKDLRFISGF